MSGCVHPVAWMVWTLCASLVAIATTNPFYLLPLLAGAFVVYAVRRRPGPGGRAFKTFLLVGATALGIRTALVVFSSLAMEAFASAALEGLRLLVLVAVYGTFNSVTDPYRWLGLAPRRFHEAALAAALALSIAPRTVEAVNRVKEAQRLRGIHVGRWRSLPALAVPVLENGMEEALTLAESMDARGHGRRARTRYRPEPWTSSASVVTVGALSAASTFLWLAGAGEGSLSVPLHPLEWPPASPWLVASVLAFAIPALLPEADTSGDGIR